MAVGINKFVLRQTPESKYSHFAGSFEELAKLAEAHFGEAKPGYRDGVVLVPVPAEGFFSGVVEVTPETPLRATFTARRKGEEPYLQVEAVGGEKSPARFVEVVLYRHDVLAVDNSASTEAEWEVISVNARATEGLEPLTPMAMARNFLRLPGGTAAEYTVEEFARAIVYWSTRAMLGAAPEPM